MQKDEMSIDWRWMLVLERADLGAVLRAQYFWEQRSYNWDYNIFFKQKIDWLGDFLVEVPNRTERLELLGSIDPVDFLLWLDP
jgi:hypothetical protein